VFEALADTRARFDLPIDLFDDLLSAFKQDVHTTRYAGWEDVLDYCRRSANPVGRLVLRLAGVRQADADEWSDAVCTALQLTNFWQDLAIDWRRGRLYVPQSVWSAAGADPTDLDRGIITPAWQRAMTECAVVTDDLFQRGRPVCDVLSGRLRYELRATWLGGTRILTAVRDAEFDVFRHRPTLGASDALVIAWKALTWRATPRSTMRS
jgi:squalene synthase HpnC